MLEGRLCGGQFAHDVLEAGLFLIGKIDTGKPEISQRLVDNTELRRAGVIAQLAVDSGISLLQARVL